MEGQNVTIELRWSEGRDDRLPELAAELVRLRVNVIVPVGAPAALAAKQATSSIPIVMGAVSDPVGAGLVPSLARPGGNITGVSLFYPELAAKRLQLLQEILPRLSRTAVLWNVTNPAKTTELKAAQDAAPGLRITLQLLPVRDARDFKQAFEAARLNHSEAFLELGDALTFIHRSQIIDGVAKLRIPAAYQFKQMAQDGGLMAYGPDFPETLRRTARYVDKILKGENPADLPIEQPTKFELVVNLKTAKALGLTIPQSLLLRADQLIE